MKWWQTLLEILRAVLSWFFKRQDEREGQRRVEEQREVDRTSQEIRQEVRDGKVDDINKRWGF